VAGFVKFWHYPSQACVCTIRDELTQPLTLDFNLAFDTLAVAGYSDQIRVYDVATKQLLNTLASSSSTSVNGHSSRVYCVKFDGAERNRLVSGGWDDTLQIWDQRCAQSQAYIYGPHVCGETLDIDAEHGHLLCGSWRKNNTVQIFDLRNGARLVRDVFRASCPMMVTRAGFLAAGTTDLTAFVSFV